jgi:hypothetical protein
MKTIIFRKKRIKEITIPSMKKKNKIEKKKNAKRFALGKGLLYGVLYLH